MNTNSLKKTYWFAGVIGLTLLIGAAYILSARKSDHQRKIASLMDQANPEWTNGQKLKWAVTKQFDISITEQELNFATPMAADLCAENHGLAIKLQANELMVAGRNPEIKILIGCEAWLAKPNYKITINLKELAKLHQNKTLKLDDLQLSASLIYKDDEWPTEWTLSGIEVVGPNGFEFNQFEMQEALQKLFTVSIK